MSSMGGVEVLKLYATFGTRGAEQLARELRDLDAAAKRAALSMAAAGKTPVSRPTTPQEKGAREELAAMKAKSYLEKQAQRAQVQSQKDAAREEAAGLRTKSRLEQQVQREQAKAQKDAERQQAADLRTKSRLEEQANQARRAIQEKARRQFITAGGAGGTGGMVAGMTALSAAATGAVAAIGAVVLAYKTLIEVVHETVQEFANLEAAQLRLGTLNQATGGAAGFTTSQFQDMAKKMSKGSVFTEREVTQAQFQLARGGEVRGKQFERGMEAAKSLTVLTGQSLPETAQQLERAMNDPEHAQKMLRQAGLAPLTRPEHARMQAFMQGNQVEKAQEILLNKIPQLETGQGLEGQIKRLNNEFNELEVNIGKAFAPIVSKGVSALEALLKELNKIDAETWKAAASFVSFVSGFDALRGAIDRVADLVKAIKDAKDEIGKLAKQIPLVEDAWNFIKRNRGPEIPGVGNLAQDLEARFPDKNRRRVEALKQLEQAKKEQAFADKANEDAKKLPRPMQLPLMVDIAGLMGWAAQMAGKKLVGPPDPRELMAEQKRVADERVKVLQGVAAEAGPAIPRINRAGPAQFVGLDQSWKRITERLMGQKEEDKQLAEQQKANVLLQAIKDILARQGKPEDFKMVGNKIMDAAVGFGI